jgi:putative PIN family toxin of toxin-antitoxin system
MQERQRLILDTMVWLDWLVFDDAGVAPLREAFEEGRVEIFIDPACEAELVRVLGYAFGKHTLNVAGRVSSIGEYGRIARPIERALTDVELKYLPRCADPYDQKFLEAAFAAHADYLITKDDDLLAVARRAGRNNRRALPFAIMTPQSWLSLQALPSARASQ